MRIGIDLDGVLANFTLAYTLTTISITGRDLFPAGWMSSAAFPPCWDYPQAYGYTDEDMTRVWREITKPSGFAKGFWRDLTVMNQEDIKAVRSLQQRHDVYFMTVRPGETARQQTDAWLEDVGLTPCTLICASKGPLAAALQLDAFIDDRPENCRNVQDACPRCRVFLLDAPYNQEADGSFHRVISVRHALDALGI